MENVNTDKTVILIIDKENENYSKSTNRSEDNKDTNIERTNGKTEDNVDATSITDNIKETIISFTENKISNDLEKKIYESNNNFKEITTYHMIYSKLFGGNRKTDNNFQVYLAAEDSAPLDYDPSSRNGFVLHVSIITFIMLAVTSMFAIFVYTTPGVRRIFEAHGLIILIGSLGVSVAAQIVLSCLEIGRQPPCNYICLVLLTGAYSCTVSMVSIRYRTEIIMLAFLSTTAVLLVCIMLALTSFDFTKWYLYLIAFSVVISLITMALLVGYLFFNYKSKPLNLGLGIIATLLQVGMLIAELQMILGGKATEINEDEYAYGAMLLYTSIISLFLKLIRIIGMLDEWGD